MVKQNYILNLERKHFNMKKRILNLLFLSSTLLLAGCQNLQTSSPAESTPAPESTPEVESTVE